MGATVDTSVAIKLLATNAIKTTASGLIDPKIALQCVLAGGDDYELVFTAPAAKRRDVARAATRSATPVTHIGSIEPALGLRLIDGAGQRVTQRFASFDHFA